MKQTTRDNLKNLRTVGLLQPGNKLETYGSLIKIYHDSFFNWFSRMWNKDGKDETMNYLKSLYSKIDDEVSLMLDSSRSKTTLPDVQILVNYTDVIRQSISGLYNLSVTYKNYPHIVAEINGIVNDMAVLTYHRLLEAIPEERLTPRLKEDLLFGSDIVFKSKYDTTHRNTPIDQL